MNVVAWIFGGTVVLACGLVGAVLLAMGLWSLRRWLRLRWAAWRARKRRHGAFGRTLAVPPDRPGLCEEPGCGGATGPRWAEAPDVDTFARLGPKLRGPGPRCAWHWKRPATEAQIAREIAFCADDVERDWQRMTPAQREGNTQ